MASRPADPVARRAALAGAAFALVVAAVQITGAYLHVMVPGTSATAALIQLVVVLGIAYGASRGGFGWAGILALLTTMAPLAALGPLYTYWLGVLDPASALLWAAYGVAGLIAAPFTVRATWHLWRLHRQPAVTNPAPAS